MTGSTSSAHLLHDELLLARFFGDDVDPAEAAQARERIASCEACAALYADLGAAADGLRRMVPPALSRDFRLTAADASRLMPRRGLRGRLGVLVRWARPAGGALMAAGLAGVLLTANGAMVHQTASNDGLGESWQRPVTAQGASTGNSAATRAVFDGAAQSARTGGAGVPENTPLTHGYTSTADQSTPPKAAYTPGSPVAVIVTASPGGGGLAPAAGTTGPEGYSAATQVPQDNGEQKLAQNAAGSAGTPAVAPPQAVSTVPDLRAVLALVASGLAVVLGFALLVGPSLARRLPRRR